MVQYDAIQQKNNKNNRKAFSMMRYCTIEGYAYDVTDDIIKEMNIRWRYQSPETRKT